MKFLKQSTQAIVPMGPFVDKSDGVTLKADSTCVTDIDHASTGIFLIKNGGTGAIRHQAIAAASVPDAYGMMLVTLDATDTGTLGRLRVMFAKAATYIPVWEDFQVLPAAIFDSLVTGSGGAIPNVAAGGNGGLGTTNGAKLNQTVDLTSGQSIVASSVPAVTLANGAHGGAAATLALSGAAGLVATKIDAPINGVITGNITGNLSGSVGSIPNVTLANSAHGGAGATIVLATPIAATVPDSQKVDVNTIKTKGVNVDSGGTTFPASIGTSTLGGTAQTGDSYAVVTNVTYGLSALNTLLGIIAGYVDTEIATILTRIGAWTGTGVNTILGAFKALLSKAASVPSDIGGTFDPATDSTEAIRDTAPIGTAMRGTDSALLASGYTAPPSAATVATAVRDVNNQTPAALSLGAAVNLASAPTANQVAAAVRDVSNASPASGSLGAKVNQAAAAAVGAGSGAITWAYTLTNSLTGLPIADADIWVTTDLAGANVIASGKTSQTGVVTFYLDAGTIYVWRQKSGWDFANPDTEVVV